MPTLIETNFVINPFNAVTDYYLPSGQTNPALEFGILTQRQVGAEWVRWRWVRWHFSIGAVGVVTGVRHVIPQWSEDPTGVTGWFKDTDGFPFHTADQPVTWRSLVAFARMRVYVYHLGPNEAVDTLIKLSILLE